MADKIKITIKPTTEMIVSRTVQIFNVCGTSKSKNSLNIQKPASLTCEAANEPAPIASTTNAGLTAVWLATKGATIPAVVKPATVADPTDTRKITAINHAKMIGDNDVCENAVAIAVEIPPAVKIPLKAAPPPITINKLAIDFNASDIEPPTSDIVRPCFGPIDQIAKAIAITIAITGLPNMAITRSSVDGSVK